MAENKKDSQHEDWSTLELIQRIVRNTNRELERPKTKMEVIEGVPDWVHLPMLSFRSDTMIDTRYRHITVPNVFASIRGTATPVDVIILGTSYRDPEDQVSRAVHITLFNKMRVDDKDLQECIELVGFIQRGVSSNVGVVFGMVIDDKTNKQVINTHPAIAIAAKVLALSFQEQTLENTLNETIKED